MDETLDWHPPAAGYRRYLLISNVFFWLALTAILSVSLGLAVADERVRLAALVAPIAAGAGATVYQLAAARRRAHALGEHALFYRSGLWWRREVAIPCSRIQHVARTQGPVERIFDFSSLQVYTAGAAQADLTIPGLETAVSRALEDELLVRADLARTACEDDEAAAR